MRTIIAIDPDTNKSGVAILQEGKISYYALNFFDLQDKMNDLSDAELYIEAGWLNHPKNFRYNGNIQRISNEVSARVGANHQIGKLIEEFAKKKGMSYHLVKPLKKNWKGQNGKITSAELNRLLTAKGYEPLKRSNQDQRDAILILLKVL